MAGWHPWLNGRECEWTPGIGDGQGGLACCDSWGHKESDTTEWLNWTELNSHDGLKLPSHLPFPLLAQIWDALWQHMDNLVPRPHPNLPYPCLHIGDKVYMTVQSHSDLTPKWQGLYTIILLTPTAAKLKEITPWVHITWLKKVMQPNDENAYHINSYQVSHTGPTALKFSRLPLAPTDDGWAYRFICIMATVISGTTPGIYLGCESSRIHVQAMLKTTSSPSGCKEPFITFILLKSNSSS